MAADYDLVIWGGTLAGRQAAREARSWGARVALVEPPDLERSSLWHRQCHQTFVQLAHQTYRRLWPSEAQWSAKPNPLWQQVKPLAAIALEVESLDPLMLMGVDLCWGSSRFITRPRLALMVGDRILEGHAYLLAMGAETERPPGAPADRILTPETLFQRDNTAFQSIAIAGSTPTAVELAQAFNRLGTQTTLLAEGDRLLPQFDQQTARQAHYRLEAEGVTVVLQSPVTTLTPRLDRVLVTSGAQPLEPDAIIIATPPNLHAPGLDPLGLTRRRGQGVWVNARLQTSHPRVFACGESLGHQSPMRARYEAHIAVKNALFWPISRLVDHPIPEHVALDPPLAQVGLTAEQARLRYGKQAVTVLHSALPTTVAHPNTGGWCTVLVHRRGRILGAQLIAPQAGEQIEAIALAMRYRFSVTALAEIPVVGAMVHRWQSDRRQKNPWLTLLLDTWFNWRR